MLRLPWLALPAALLAAAAFAPADEPPSAVSDAASATATPGVAPAPAPRPGPAFVWPTSGWITATEKYHDGRNHSGSADIAAPYALPIGAAREGTVTKILVNSKYGGWCVKIDHGGGWATIYSHMIQTPAVKVGDAVRTNQLLGYVGRTGNAAHPHCHFEIAKDGKRLPIAGLAYGDWARRGAAVPGDYPGLDGSPAEPSTFRAVVTDDGLPLRKEPSDRDAAAETLASGTTLTVLDTDRGFWRVEHEGRTGWVPQSGATPESSTAFGLEITAERAAVRAQPDAAAEEVGPLSHGAKVTAFEEKDGWFRILYRYNSPTCLFRWIQIADAKRTAAFRTAVRAATVEVHAGPSVDDAVLGQLKFYSPLEVLETRAGWYRIKFGGKDAWIEGWTTQGRV